jgi:hypothetical protein
MPGAFISPNKDISNAIVSGDQIIPLDEKSKEARMF